MANFYGGDGNDSSGVPWVDLYGGDGNDTLNGNITANQLYGGQGDDLMLGGLVLTSAGTGSAAGSPTLKRNASFVLSDRMIDRSHRNDCQILESGQRAQEAVIGPLYVRCTCVYRELHPC